MSTRTATVSPGLSLRPPRKIRADAKLEHLSAPQRVRLRTWLADENRTYAAIVALIRTEFGLTVGKSAVGVYYQRHILTDQRDEELEAATALSRLPLANVSVAHLHRAKALAWLLLVRPVPQIDAAIRLLNVIRRVEGRELRRQRLALQAERAALREAVTARRSTPAATPAAPASSREISPNPLRFPGYSRQRQPSTTAPLTSSPTPPPPSTGLHAQDPRPHPLDPTPASANPAFQPPPPKPPQISPRFPAYSRTLQPTAPALLAA